MLSLKSARQKRTGIVLLMLVWAFASLDRVLTAYQEAIDERYRLYSFGDAMLVV